jgi:hypothetical protein
MKGNVIACSKTESARCLEAITIIGRESLGFAGLRLEDLEADPRTLAPR